MLQIKLSVLKVINYVIIKAGVNVMILKYTIAIIKIKWFVLRIIICAILTTMLNVMTQILVNVNQHII